MVSFKFMKEETKSIQDFLERAKRLKNRRVKASLYSVVTNGDINYCILLEAENVLYDRCFPMERRVSEEFTPNIKKEGEQFRMVYQDLILNLREVGFEVEEVFLNKKELPKEMGEEDLAYFIKMGYIKGSLI